jgi:hypothetical protein
MMHYLAQKNSRTLIETDKAVLHNEGHKIPKNQPLRFIKLICD